MRFLLLLLPLIASAAPGEPFFPAPGSYKADQSYSVESKRRYEVVYSFTDEGRARMSELQKQGYICNGATRDTFLCKAFLSTEGEHPGLEERIARLTTEVAAEFGEVRGAAQLVSKGDSNVEWSMPQSVEFRGKHYDSYRFLFDPRTQLQRIFLGSPAEHSILASAEGRLSVPLELTVTESRQAYFRYLSLLGLGQ